MTSQLSTQSRSLITTIEASRVDLEKYLPEHLGIDRFIAQVKMALIKNPRLTECDPASVFESIRIAADLGLDPSGTLGSAYLVPYKGKCTLIPGYRGLIDLACRTGLVTSVNAYVVYERDDWHPPLAGRIPKHRPYFPMPDEDPSPGRVIGAWARSKQVNGASECVVMTFAQLETIRLRSPSVKANTGGPWKTDTDEMYRKCPIRKLMKALPLSPIRNSAASWGAVDRLARAVEIDDAEIEPDVPLETKTTKTGDKLRQKLESMRADPSPEELQVILEREAGEA